MSYCMGQNTLLYIDTQHIFNDSPNVKQVGHSLSGLIDRLLPQILWTPKEALLLWMPLGHTFFSATFSDMCWSRTMIKTLSLLCKSLQELGFLELLESNHEALGSVSITAPPP